MPRIVKDQNSQFGYFRNKNKISELGWENIKTSVFKIGASIFYYFQFFVYLNVEISTQ